MYIVCIYIYIWWTGVCAQTLVDWAWANSIDATRLTSCFAVLVFHSYPRCEIESSRLLPTSRDAGQKLPFGNLTLLLFCLLNWKVKSLASRSTTWPCCETDKKAPLDLHGRAWPSLYWENAETDAKTLICQAGLQPSSANICDACLTIRHHEYLIVLVILCFLLNIAENRQHCVWATWQQGKSLISVAREFLRTSQQVEAMSCWGVLRSCELFLIASRYY